MGLYGSDRIDPDRPGSTFSKIGGFIFIQKRKPQNAWPGLIGKHFAVLFKREETLIRISTFIIAAIAFSRFMIHGLRFVIKNSSLISRSISLR